MGGYIIRSVLTLLVLLLHNFVSCKCIKPILSLLNNYSPKAKSTLLNNLRDVAEWIIRQRSLSLGRIIVFV